MKIIPEPLKFDWDDGNREKNWIKHQISIKEVEEIFCTRPIIFFDDNKHSQKEKRYGLIGKTNSGKLLSLVFTLRTNKVRVVTARSSSRAERREYEKIKKNTKI